MMHFHKHSFNISVHSVNIQRVVFFWKKKGGRRTGGRTDRFRDC